MLMDALEVELRVRMQTACCFLRLHRNEDAVGATKNATFGISVTAEKIRTAPTFIISMIAMRAINANSHSKQILARE